MYEWVKAFHVIAEGEGIWETKEGTITTRLRRDGFPFIIWYALPRRVRHQAFEGVNFGAATDNAIGIGREVRALVRRLIRVSHWASVARRVAASSPLPRGADPPSCVG
jgi:hypothetical protein